MVLHVSDRRPRPSYLADLRQRAIRTLEHQVSHQAALKSLLDHLCYQRPDIPAGRKDVWGHGELKKAGNQTNCPGLLVGWVQKYREG
jgi:hypothetical protein